MASLPEWRLRAASRIPSSLTDTKDTIRRRINIKMRLNYIVNIDCLDGLAAIPDKSVDLIVTDPPYSINTRSSMNTNSKLNPWADLCNASFWYTAWMRECRRIIKDDGALWCFINWRGFSTIQKAGLDMGWPVESLLVWDKCCIGPGGHKGLRPSYEMVALFTNPEFTIPDRSLADIQRFKWASVKPHGHPAEKPVDLIRWIIQSSGKSGGSVILDPFIGSGTTACAALLESCNYIGFEMDSNWVANAQQRIANAREKLEANPWWAEKEKKIVVGDNQNAFDFDFEEEEE